MALHTPFKAVGNELMIGSLSASGLAREHGTPVFLYDAAVFRSKVERIRSAYPAAFDLYYSVKANPNPAIVELFFGEGCGLEIASGGELRVALASGCPPERILFAGPGKTVAELEYAVSEGIGEIHVESFEEIDRLIAIASGAGRRVAVAVRVNPSGEAQGGAMRMGGKPAQFGFDEEMLDEVVERLRAADRLRVTGVHLFTGTQILDHEILAQQYGKGVEVAARVAAQLDEPLETIDFGGGLGIPYFPNESPIDFEALAPRLEALVAEARTLPGLAEARFLLEPGRFLVGDGGVYVTCVNTVKVSRGKTYVVADGGMNHHLAASGNLGQVIKRNFPIAAVGKMAEPATVTADVVGPLCTPLDTLGRGVELPALAAGDLIGVLQSGAYAYSASPLGFLSHPTPAEVLVDGDTARVIRPRGRWDDMVVR